VRDTRRWFPCPSSAWEGHFSLAFTKTFSVVLKSAQRFAFYLEYTKSPSKSLKTPQGMQMSGSSLPNVFMKIPRCANQGEQKGRAISTPKVWFCKSVFKETSQIISSCRVWRFIHATVQVHQTGILFCWERDPLRVPPFCIFVKKVNHLDKSDDFCLTNHATRVSSTKRPSKRGALRGSPSLCFFQTRTFFKFWHPHNALQERWSSRRAWRHFLILLI